VKVGSLQNRLNGKSQIVAVMLALRVKKISGFINLQNGRSGDFVKNAVATYFTD
jgi:hypothetical protein